MLRMERSALWKAASSLLSGRGAVVGLMVKEAVGEGPQSRWWKSRNKSATLVPLSVSR